MGVVKNYNTSIYTMDDENLDILALEQCALNINKGEVIAGV